MLHGIISWNIVLTPNNRNSVFVLPKIHDFNIVDLVTVCRIRSALWECFVLSEIHFLYVMLNLGL
jgi:hypothetical protein